MDRRFIAATTVRIAGAHAVRTFDSGRVPELAALYESWTVPISVIMVVPLGILGALTRPPRFTWKTTSSSRWVC